MPSFTAFPNQLYEPDVEYISASAQVETDANWAELEVVTPGSVIDELETTEIYLAVEVADLVEGPYRLMVSALMTGTNGQALGKPGNPRFRSLVQPYRGKYVRAKMVMTNATSDQLRIRVDGRTYN